MRILSAGDSLTTENTALSLGFFDGVHLGHSAVIGKAAAMESEGLVPAAFTFGVKGGAPGAKLASGLIQTETLKIDTLRSLGVRILYRPEFDDIKGMNAEDFVNDIIVDKLRARSVFCGADFRFGKGASGDAKSLQKLLSNAGIELSIVPSVLVDDSPVSSTRIRAAVISGDMESAKKLLGRPFAIDFPVEHGRMLGRQMGLPTANQRFSEDICIPRFGVYAARVTIDGKVYAAATNIGVKPTVGSDGILAESYIIGFSGDIYGRRIKTELIEFLRPETKFDSLETLKDAIKQDAEKAEKLISQ